MGIFYAFGRLLCNILVFCCVTCSIITGYLTYSITNNKWEKEAIQMGYGVYKTNKTKYKDGSVSVSKEFYWYDHIDEQGFDKKVTAQLKEDVRQNAIKATQNKIDSLVSHKQKKRQLQERNNLKARIDKLVKQRDAVQRSQHVYTEAGDKKNYKKSITKMKNLNAEISKLRKELRGF